jgi:hypothetical protein
VFRPSYAHSRTAAGICAGARRDAPEIPSGFAGTQGATPAYAGGQCSRLGTSGIWLGEGAEVRAGGDVAGRVADVDRAPDDTCDDERSAPDRALAAAHALTNTIARTAPISFTGPQSH